MEVLKRVLIKEVDGSKEGDKVFYVENLPKSFIFRKEKKQIIDYTDQQNRQRLVPDFIVDEDTGRKRLTHAMEDVLLPGIELSQNKDGAYCFFTQYNEAKQRLVDIDRYIQSSVPVSERVPKRIPYAMQPGLLTSGPIALSDIPSVVLPAPVSPPAQAEQDEVPAAVSTTPKRAMSEEHKAKLRVSLKLARERKAAKQA